MDLSIVIVNYYLERYLPACLESIYRSINQLAYEIFLVDNGSQEGAIAKICKGYSDLRVLTNKENVGFARANNQAMKECRGDFILLLNPDTIVTPNAIDIMVDFLRDHIDAGAIGPKLLNPDGSLQYSCRAFPGLWTLLFNRYSLLTQLFPHNPFSRHYLLSDWDHNSLREVDWISGACLMTRQEVVKEVGLLDEGYFIFNEDVDWCRRMKDQGWKIYYLPEAKIIHYINSSKSKDSYRLIIERHKGMLHYFHKHYRVSLVLRLLVDGMIMGRSLWLLLLNFLKTPSSTPKG
jgi:hypothetical protein